MTRAKNNDWDAVIFKPELKRFSGTRQQDKAHIVAHVNRTNRESITESCRRFTHTLLFVVNIILPCTLSTKLPSCHLQCDHTVSISSVNSPPMSSAWAECLSPIRGIIRGEAYENPKCTDACGVVGVAGGWNIKMTGCLFLLFRCEWNVTNMVQLQQRDWGIVFFVAGSDSGNAWMLDQHPGLYCTKTEVCHHKWFKRKEGREGSPITHTHVRAHSRASASPSPQEMSHQRGWERPFRGSNCIWWKTEKQ